MTTVRAKRRSPRRRLPPPPVLPAKVDWGKYPAEIRSLSEQHRKFALALATDPATLAGDDFGKYARAARAAGYKESNTANLAKMAHKLGHDERILAGVQALARVRVELAAPLIAEKYIGLLQDPAAKGHSTAVMAGLDRLVPITTRHDISVTHKIVDPDQEALEELRALREIGATREKLVELFGGNGLARLERLEAAELAKRSNEAKIIDGELVDG